MASEPAKSVDVDSFLDALRFNRFHLTVMTLCTLLTAIDGYELYVVGWVLPLIADDFGVPRTAITSAMMSQQIGMVAGAFLIPPLADRLGRTRVLMICFGGMLAAAIGVMSTTSLAPFAAWRFVAGLCGTAVIPILVTISSETAPRRLRGTMSTATIAGTMIGSLMGSAMQAWLLEPFGWRGAFWIAVVAPAVMLPLVWLLLPETMRSLAARDPADPRIQALAQRMATPGTAVPTIVAMPRPPRTASPLRAMAAEILGPAMRNKTLLMWGVTASTYCFVTASTWKTTFFKDIIGLSWQTVGALNAANTLAGVVGMFAIGMFIDRFGFKPVMVSTFLLAAIGCTLIGVTAPSPLMFAAVTMMALFQHGGVAGVGALAAALYPPSHRATGVGWAYGAGRMASVFAPLFGAFVISEGLGPVGIFALLSIPLVTAGMFAWWLMSSDGAPKVQRVALSH